MNGFGVSALLLRGLRRPAVPGLDEDLGRHQAALRRLAVMVGLQLTLMLGLTLAVP